MAADRGVQTVSRLFLWLNSGCNARCRMCDIWREPVGTAISAAQVEEWIPEWVRMAVTRVILCGEPLLHPNLVGVCGTIRDSGIRVEVLTNGLNLERRAEDVVSSCDVLRVSLDGPSAVHNATRGRLSSFARLQRGLQRLREFDPSFPVDGRCAVHRGNFRHLRDTVTAAKQLGLRSISFSGTDLSNEEAFRREGRITADYVGELEIRGDDLEDLVTEVEALKNDFMAEFESGFISDPPARLDSILVDYYRGMAGEGLVPVPRCNAPWTSAVIEYDGTVRPCFPLPPYGANVLEVGSLDAAINSDAAVAFRAGLDVATNSACLGCVCQTFIEA